MKVVLIVLIFLVVGPVLASKARLNSLSNSSHLIDEQLLFSNPLEINYLENFISLESGSANASSTATSLSGAEALFGYKINDTNIVVIALGHQEAAVISSRAFINSLGSTYDLTQNPVHFFYGSQEEDFNYSFGFYASRFENKINSTKEISSGLTAAVELGAWQLIGAYNIENAAEVASKKFEGTGSISGTLNYIGEAAQMFFSLSRSVAKSSTLNIENENHITQKLNLGLIESTVKEFNDVFWGAQIVSTKVECHRRFSLSCERAYESSFLPVWVGFEAQAEKWLTVRGAITQTVLANQLKDEVGYPVGSLTFATGGVADWTNGPNSTLVTAGLGLNYKKVSVDGILSGAINQQLNQNSFLTQLAIKYAY